MISYVLLLFACVIAWLASLRVSSCELLAPGPIILLGFGISLTLSLIGWGRWNDVVLSVETICVVLTGLLSVVAAVFVSSTRPCFSKRIIRWGEFSLPEGRALWKYALLLFAVVFAIVLRVQETYAIAHSLGIAKTGYSEMAAAVRHATAAFMSADAMKLNVGFSFAERQMEKIVIAIGYVSACLMAKAASEKNKTGLICSTVVLASACLFCLVAGGRGNIMYYGISLFVMYSIFAYRKTDDSKGLTKRLLIVGAAFALIVAVGMYFASAIVGRTARVDIIDYVSFYFGGSIPSLDLLLENYDAPDLPPGVNTFYYLFAPLFKFGVIPSYPNYSLAWYQLGGISSNIFTCFARYYVDFGYIGVAVLSFAATYIMQAFYCLARRNGAAPCVLLAGYIGAYAFDCGREEFIFSRLLSTSHLLILLLAIVILLFMTTSIHGNARDLLRHFKRDGEHVEL